MDNENNTEKRQKINDHGKFRILVSVLVIIAYIFFILSSLKNNGNFLFSVLMVFSISFYILSYIFSIFIFAKGILNSTITLNSSDIQKGLYALTLATTFIYYSSDKLSIIDFGLITENVIFVDFFITLSYLTFHSVNSFIIVANIINIIYNLSIYLNYKIKPSYTQRNKPFNLKHNDITSKIDIMTDKIYEQIKLSNIFKRLFLVIAYVLLFTVEISFNLIYPVFHIPIHYLLKFLKWLIKKFKNLHLINFGKAIYMAARLSLIYSSTITFIIFSYYNVISNNGFLIFEFMTTIFLLPIIFNEINEFKIRNK